VVDGPGKTLALLQKRDRLREVADKTDLQRVVKRLRLRGIPIDEKRTAEPQRLCRTAGISAFSGKPGLNVARNACTSAGRVPIAGRRSCSSQLTITSRASRS
jgi:hypothetical protein